MAKKIRLGTSWLTAGDVRSLHETAIRNRDQLGKLLDSTHAKISNRVASLEDNLKDVPAASRDVAIARGLAGYRGELKEQTLDARTGHIRSAAELRAKAASVKPHYRSPAQMLARYTLGSEKRSRISQQIEHSGPAELLSLADLAAATDDKDLGAALASRVFAMPSEKRPFEVSDLADALVGQEWREVNKALDDIDNIAVDMTRLDRDFENGRTDGTSLIKQALRQRAAEEIYGEDDDDGES